MAERCPLCAGERLTVAYEYPAFRLLRCETCALLFRERGPGIDTAQLIQETYDDQWVQMRHQWAASTFQEHALFQVTLLGSVRPERGLLLEIGSGTGEFAYLARQAGWDVVGVEPSANACRYAQARYNLELVNAVWSPELLPADLRFDAICFWHVLEHIPDPVAFLQDVKSRLAEGGLVLFAVPNRESFTNEIWGAESPLLTEADHLCHYSAQNLRLLLAKAGLEPVQLFSREEPARLKQDIAAWEQRTGEKFQAPLHETLGLLVRLQADFQGHELFCVACPRGE
jgi:SAM-dependent methyltransferase